MMDNDLRELYQEVILDHGKNPRNFRKPSNLTCEAAGHNPLCGDRLTVFLKISESEVIEDVAFEGKGCAISIASASMMTEIVNGKTIIQAKELFERFHHLCAGDDGSVIDEKFAAELDKLKVLSGVRQYPMRVKCATLSWHALVSAAGGQGEATTE